MLIYIEMIAIEKITNLDLLVLPKSMYFSCDNFNAHVLQSTT